MVLNHLKSKLVQSRSLIFLLSSLLFVNHNVNSAVFQTMAGGSGIWTDGNNWVGGVAPSTTLDGNDITVDHPLTTPNLNASSGGGAALRVNNTLNVTGTFTISNINAVSLNGTGLLNVNDFDVTATTATGTANLAISANSMTYSGTRGYNFNRPVNISGDLDVTGGPGLRFNSTASIGGDFNMGAGVIVRSVFNVTGASNLTSGRLSLAGTATPAFTGDITITGNGNILSNNAAGFTTVGNVVVNGSNAELVANNDVTIGGNLSIINRGDADFNSDLTVGGDVLIDGSTSDLRVFGDFVGGGNVTSMGNRGEIEFRGRADIAGNVSVSERSNIEFRGVASVNGSVSVTSNGAFVEFRSDSYTGSISITNNGDVRGNGVLDYDGLTITTGGTICNNNETDPTMVPDPVRLNNCSAGVLPIELSYFTAEQNNNSFLFHWETLSELNNDYFTIEFSYDGINFTHLLSEINGNGTVNKTSNYSQKIESNKVRSSNELYFRLKQTDYDGAFSYSPIEILQTKQIEQTTEFNLYPNPSTFSTQIEILNFDVNTEYLGRLVNSQGITQGKEFKITQKTQIIDTARLAPGLYFIYVNGMKHHAKLSVIN